MTSSTVAVGYGVVSAKGLVPIADQTLLANVSGATAFPVAVPISSITGETLAVGTTPITGGTTTYLLYNNAGVLGNTTTPAVTSLALGGATIGGNALAVTGTSLFTGAVTMSGGNFNVGGNAILMATSSSTVTDNGNGAILYRSANGLNGVTLNFGTDSTLKLFGRDGTTQAALQSGTLAIGGATIGSNALAVTGQVTFAGGSFFAPTNGMYVGSSTTVNALAFNGQANGDVMAISTGRLGFTSSTTNANGTPDTYLTRDGAGILAQRNSTNPQQFAIYNTYTDASNNEQGGLKWSSNVLLIGQTAAPGSGSSRAVSVVVGNGTVAGTFASSGALFTAGGALQSAAPSGSTAGQWKLGALQTAAVVLDTTRSIFVDIGGTVYKLMVAQ